MERSLSLSLGKGGLSLPQSCLSLGLESLLLNEGSLSLSLSLSLLLRSEGSLSLSLGLSLLLDQSGLSLSLSILLGRGSCVHSRDHLGPEGGEDLGSDSGLVRGGHLDKTGYVHCALVLCTITWEIRELRRTLAWDCRAVCTADLMVGVRVTTICWTRDSFSDSDTETWARSLAIW